MPTEMRERIFRHKSLDDQLTWLKSVSVQGRPLSPLQISANLRRYAVISLKIQAHVVDQYVLNQIIRGWRLPGAHISVPAMESKRKNRRGKV